jgi:hypothetical protein
MVFDAHLHKARDAQGQAQGQGQVQTVRFSRVI